MTDVAQQKLFDTRQEITIDVASDNTESSEEFTPPIVDDILVKMENVFHFELDKISELITTADDLKNVTAIKGLFWGLSYKIDKAKFLVQSKINDFIDRNKAEDEIEIDTRKDERN